MSLLDGLKEAMINPLFESVEEADTDAELDFEMALEAVIDDHIELSDADVIAIMDDENPDNIVADMTSKDENESKIEEDAMDDGTKALEAALDELLALENELPVKDDPADDPESTPALTEGCNSKALEMDDDDAEYDEDDENEDDEDYVSLDSLLGSIFKN